MVDDVVLAVCNLFFHTVVHQVRGELARRRTAVIHSPHNTVVLALFINFRKGDIILRRYTDIAQKFSAPCCNKKFTRQIFDGHADGLPLPRYKTGTHDIDFFRPYTVGQIAPVALMPALSVSIIRQADKLTDKLGINNSHSFISFYKIIRYC